MSGRTPGYAQLRGAWKWVVVWGAIVGTVLAVSVGGPAIADDSHDRGASRVLRGTWSASPQLAGAFPVPFATGFSNQTLREVVHTSVGGEAVRVRLSNTFGTAPVTFDSVYIGLQQDGASVRANRLVSFGSRNSITLAPGAEALSDLVNLRVDPEQNLSVSLFTAGTTGTPTVHIVAAQTNYISGSGNFGADEAGTAFTSTSTSWYFLDGIDVITTPQVKGTIVAFGDSITDGVASTVNANHRWPNLLFQRLRNAPGKDVSVVDEGISGNRVLNDSSCFGVNAQARLDRDVLAQDGVKFVILLEGINDIGFSAIPIPPNPTGFLACAVPNPDVSAEQISAGYQQIIARVHAQGIQIFGGTLLPFRGAGYFTEAGEAKRQAVNTWIRTSGEFDGVIDFDKATRDPANPSVLQAAFDSGDHLHPNDAGYQAMANAVNLRFFK